MTAARWQVLGMIDHRPSTVADVARTMGLTRQSVQQTADALARDGLVDLIDNPRHRRAKLLTPTAAGRTALAEVEARQAEWANGLAAGLDPGRLADVRALLRDLGHQLDPERYGRPDDRPDLGGALGRTDPGATPTDRIEAPGAPAR
ncbi:MarR family transcriptional regulator [Micromonospora sp. NBC_01699]